MISLTREGEYLLISCVEMPISQFRTLPICNVHKWFKILRSSTNGYELVEMADEKRVTKIISKYISSINGLNEFRLVATDDRTVIAGICIVGGKNYSRIIEGIPNDRKTEELVSLDFRNRLVNNRNSYAYIYVYIPNVTGIAKKMCILDV